MTGIQKADQRNTISWLPPWVSKYDTQWLEIRTSTAADEKVCWLCERPDSNQWDAVAEEIRAVGECLKRVPIAQIVESIDRIALRWCDPNWSVRLAVREKVIQATAFSPESVDRSFDLELRNYKAESLWRTLRREFGDPNCLDAFADNLDLRGKTIAIGPKLVLAVYTGNVPGLPALSMIRSLLVKAPVIAKVASGEPSFAASFAESLFEELPILGEAILVTYWDRGEESLATTISNQAEIVIAYGGTAAIRSLREAVPPHIRIIEHGHKLSVGFISRKFLSEFGNQTIAALIAKDVAIFDQHACIAPQAYFIESSREEAEILAAQIGSALSAESETYPAGQLGTVDAARIRLARTQQQWKASTRPDYQIWHADDFEWTVTLDDKLTSAEGIGHRFLRIIPVNRFSDTIDQLKPFSSYLQNIGLGCTKEELNTAAASLAEIGASRICEPGKMAEPSMMWRHDGHPCVADLARWCDVEMHRSLSE